MWFNCWGHCLDRNAIALEGPPPNIQFDQDLVVHRIEGREGDGVVPFGMLRPKARMVALHQPGPHHPLARGAREAKGETEVDGCDTPPREPEPVTGDVRPEEGDIVCVDPDPFECLCDILLGQEDRHSGELQGPPQDHPNDFSVAGLKRGWVCRRVGPLIEDALVPDRPTFVR